MSKIVALVVLVLVLVLILAGAVALPLFRSDAAETKTGEEQSLQSSENAEKRSIRITDDMGREVELPAHPQRIACTTSFSSEMLLALGEKPVLRVKIEEQYIYPPEAKDIPEMDVNHAAGPNLEQLVAGRPDLVITSPTFARFVPTIEQRLNVPVLILQVKNFASVEEKLRLLARITNKEKEADRLIEEMETDVGGISSGLPEQSPKVVALFGTPESYFGFRPESYLGSLIERMGGKLATAGEEPAEHHKTLTTFSMEHIVAQDPDVIVMVYHGPPSDWAESLQKTPVWKGLKAVRNGRVHTISQWLFVMNPGLRATEALRQLKPLLYPESKGDSDGTGG